MSRLYDVLHKAERDGTARRTRGMGSVADAPVSRAAVDLAPPTAPAPVAGSAVPRVPDAPPQAGTQARLAGRVRMDARLVAALAPDSLPAEQFRALRTRMLQDEAHPRRVLLVTSPQRGDGKSLTSANLALTMGQEFNRRVLLVDADLRGGTVHRMFGLDAEPGLSDLLTGACQIDQALLHVAPYNLTVLTRGAATERPAELLGSKGMRRLLDHLRGRFDRVILDTPPAAPLADVQVLSPLADGILVVVRAGRTTRPAIERALNDLEPAKLMGLVLNDTEPFADGDYVYGYTDQAPGARPGRRAPLPKGRQRER